MKEKMDFTYESLKEATNTDTVFCRSLVSTGMLTEEQTRRAAGRYCLGRSKDGGVVFWEIDDGLRVRDGKIMFYGEDCHRDKGHDPSWASSRMKQSYGYEGDIAIERCLFGLHLLKDEGTAEATVAVVEAEKTAVICSELFPQYLWLAAGGLSMLSVAKLYPLRDRKVVVFPDTDQDGTTYGAWQKIAEAAQLEFSHPIRMSRILEDHARPEQKAAKIDIVDLIFEK